MFITKPMSRAAVVLAILAFSVIPEFRVAAQTRGKIEAKTITLGLVSEINQKEIEEHFKPLASYVAKKLSSASTIEGRVVVAPTQSRLASLLTERKADFYFESPYPTYSINSVYGAGKLLLRRWKGGVADYHSMIFTKKDSDTKRLEDLRGRMIAFEDPESTSGYFLAKSYLSRKGFKLSQKSKIDASVARREVGYIFASSQDKLVELVLAKKAAAGAFSSDDYAALGDTKKADVTVLAETASLPRHLVSVRKDLPPALSSGLEKILLSMHQDPEGKQILQKADATTKFDALPGGELGMRQRLLDVFYSPAQKFTLVEVLGTLMCRNIRTLFNFEPPVTDEEIRAASLQFVRNVTGFNKPSKANEARFLAAVDEIAVASGKLLASLETSATPKNRLEETAKARARAAQRFSSR